MGYTMTPRLWVMGALGLVCAAAALWLVVRMFVAWITFD